ncbi:MAG: NAD(+) synthase [Pelagibacterales bacterium]|nr:NAD(+) synthase [Pelagibacterales bacterium]
MQPKERVDYIKTWIVNYCNLMEKKPSCLVVGVSGGIDSAVVSTISALTGFRVKALSMPIRQLKFQDDLSRKHIKWLLKNFSNVDEVILNLDETFDSFEKTLDNFKSEHASANSRARLRMTTLYQVAGSCNGIVVGTGNKVEDFGVGFYTKYGDGGVDISPIADCTKTDVWDMGKYLGIAEEIIKAEPTDGLWVDGRTDEKQLGMSYQELEKAMRDPEDKNYKKYLEIRKKNLHKINPIPVCTFKNEK